PPAAPPPPRSPLFPYTTLFRSHPPEWPESVVVERHVHSPLHAQRGEQAFEVLGRFAVDHERDTRSDVPLVCDEAVAESQSLAGEDRKSTRLNSSHVSISYAVFC